VAGELPGQSGQSTPVGSLLLDAAFLVRRSRSKSFRAIAVREARALSHGGYGLTLSGPWPPYTFVQD
jgi:Gas vesicle synthesis protein GvpL/GvpF